jgi:hypothetical protein
VNHYQEKNAVHIIDGYFLPTPSETERAAFERAKADALHHLGEQMQHVAAITFERFTHGKS